MTKWPMSTPSKLNTSLSGLALLGQPAVATMIVDLSQACFLTFLNPTESLHATFPSWRFEAFFLFRSAVGQRACRLLAEGRFFSRRAWSFPLAGQGCRTTEIGF